MSDRYGVKEIFLTLQGEGARAGTKAVFLRFTGCNLWNGAPAGRSNGEGSCAEWCDTDFFKGKVMTVEEILLELDKAWPRLSAAVNVRWVVLTGGEPCLQINDALMDALHEAGWAVAVETNGTEPNEAVGAADFICVAPKLGRDGEPLPLVLSRVDEVKVVLPGDLPLRRGWTPDQLNALYAWGEDRGVKHFFVQPMDPLVDPSFVEQTALKRTKEVDTDIEERLDAQWKANLQQCIRQVLKDPRWRLSLQTHKLIGVP